MEARSTGTATTSAHKVDYKVDLDDNYRHWSPNSQTYAPADVLVRHLRTGWTLEPMAAVETFYYAGYRRVDVYFFTLKKDDTTLEMPVLGNPAVRRLIEEQKLTVVRSNVTTEEID